LLASLSPTLYVGVFHLETTQIGHRKWGGGGADKILCSLVAAIRRGHFPPVATAASNKATAAELVLLPLPVGSDLGHDLEFPR
jgi:hypothetical protein